MTKLRKNQNLKKIACNCKRFVLIILSHARCVLDNWMRFAGLMGRAMMSIDFYIMLKLQEISLFAQIKALITVHHD